MGARAGVDRCVLIIGGCRREAVGRVGIPEMLEVNGSLLASLSVILARCCDCESALMRVRDPNSAKFNNGASP